MNEREKSNKNPPIENLLSRCACAAILSLAMTPSRLSLATPSITTSHTLPCHPSSSINSIPSANCQQTRHIMFSNKTNNTAPPQAVAYAQPIAAPYTQSMPSRDAGNGPALIDFRPAATRGTAGPAKDEELDMITWGVILAVTACLSLPCCIHAACGSSSEGYCSKRPCGAKSPCDCDRCPECGEC
jgi:hypothetical protein